MRALIVFWLIASASFAEQIPLCCGRGGTPVGPRSTVPLAERESPWAGDVVLALEGRGSPALEVALSRVPGVSRAEVDPRGLARVWLRDRAAAPVAELCRAAKASGSVAVPALLTRIAFGEAGEKGLVERAGAQLRGTAGVVDCEVEVDGESAVARVWHRPGTAPEAFLQALSRQNVSASVVR